MKHIRKSKYKSDKIDAGKLATLLRGGLFPLAYAYPKAKRQTHNLLQRRSFFVRRRAQRHPGGEDRADGLSPVAQAGAV